MNGTGVMVKRVSLLLQSLSSPKKAIMLCLADIFARVSYRAFDQVTCMLTFRFTGFSVISSSESSWSDSAAFFAVARLRDERLTNDFSKD